MSHSGSVNYADSRESSQLLLSTFIHYLQQLRNTHGNIPVLFWSKDGDHNSSDMTKTPYVICQFVELNNFIDVDNGTLWIGGFDEFNKTKLQINM